MTRLFPLFSAAFAVLYVACMHYNVAAVIYYPSMGEWHARPVANGGPPMFLYGWLIYAFLGATVASLAAALIPAPLIERVWSGWIWVTGAGAVVVSVYFMYRIWFVSKA